MESSLNSKTVWKPNVIVLTCVPTFLREAEIRVTLPRRIAANLSGVKVMRGHHDVGTDDEQNRTTSNEVFLTFRDEESENNFLEKEVGSDGNFWIGRYKTVLLRHNPDNLIREVSGVLCEVKGCRVDSSSDEQQQFKDGFEGKAMVDFDRGTVSSVGRSFGQKAARGYSPDYPTKLVSLQPNSLFSSTAQEEGWQPGNNGVIVSYPAVCDNTVPPPYHPMRGIALQSGFDKSVHHAPPPQHRPIRNPVPKTALIYVGCMPFHHNPITLREELENDFGKVAFIRVFHRVVEMTGKHDDGSLERKTFVLPQGTACVRFQTLEAEKACLSAKVLRNPAFYYAPTRPKWMTFRVMTWDPVRDLEQEFNDEMQALQMIKDNNNNESSSLLKRDEGIIEEHNELRSNRTSYLDFRGNVRLVTLAKVAAHVTDYQRKWVQCVLKRK